MSTPKFRPALRTVDAGGNVLTGPLAIYQPNSLGIIANANPEYAAERLGNWSNLSYSFLWKFLGYRPMVALHCPFLSGEPAQGLALLRPYFAAGLASESFAALQFTLFDGGGAVWRGVIPSTSWTPRKVSGKEGLGWELDLTLEGRDLIQTLPDLSTGTW